MKFLTIASVLLLTTTVGLALMPAASAAPITCPPPYTGVWVETPAGPVGFCCDLNRDPSPCYQAPRHV